MIKKRLLAISITMALALGLIGCSKKEPVAPEETNTVETEKIEEQKEMEADDLQLLAQEGKGRTSTEDGMYRLVMRQIQGQTCYVMYYVDFASKQEIVLCNDASCKHDSTKCMGIFDSSDLSIAQQHHPFIHNGKLYVFEQDDPSGSSYVESISEQPGNGGPTSEKAKLLQMNLDGTDRKCVYTFPEDMILGNEVIGGKDALYFITKEVTKVTNDAGYTVVKGGKQKLQKLDIKKWKLQEAVALEDETQVVDVIGTKLICRRTSYPGGVNPDSERNMSFEEWRTMFNGTMEIFEAISVETGEVEKLAEASNKNLNSVVVWNGKLYLEGENASVQVIDVESKQVEQVTFPNQFGVALVEAYSDRIYCWNVDDSDEKGYFWNPETGELNERSMRQKSAKLNMEILAENKEGYLLLYDIDGVEAADGSYEVKRNKYGWISKKDMYEGSYEITPIKMVSKGLEFMEEE